MKDKSDFAKDNSHIGGAKHLSYKFQDINYQLQSATVCEIFSDVFPVFTCTKVHHLQDGATFKMTLGSEAVRVPVPPMLAA